MRDQPAVGGDRRYAVRCGHGTVPRGQDETAGSGAGPGRFAKLFPCLDALELDCATIDEMVRVLENASGAPFAPKSNIVALPDLGFSAIPAGFTYFGQFVDHDITFDPTSTRRRADDPHAFVDFRTPRLDLDSLYGTGPADQPFLYDRDYEVDGAMLLVDRIADGATPLLDLPRNGQGRALIGDPRNDEHLIISQLHLLFIGLHNAVVQYLHERVRVPDVDLFERSREIVRWHYQWIVVHEFLEHIVGPEVAKSVLVPGGPGEPSSVRLEYYRPEARPFMPLEFSAAAYRFGHSMVRPDYRINDHDPLHPRRLPIIERFPGQHLSLSGERRLTDDLVIDWRRFFVLPGAADPDLPQLARQINPTIAPPLFHLPHGRSLPRLNIERGSKVGLPSGQQVAHAMGCDALSSDDLHLSRFAPAYRQSIGEATPLWFYLLCEALAPPSDGERLGPVGGRIVAEVLVGLLAGDPDSYFSRSSSWTPHIGPTPGCFTMADLVRIARCEIEPGSVQGLPED